MTGRTPYRVGMYQAIPEQSYQMELEEVGPPMHLRESEVTVASLLKLRGYQTAVVGKWHLNGLFNSSQQPQPNEHGFDFWFATQNNAQPHHLNPFNFVRNGDRVPSQSGYSSEIIVDEAIKWLTSEREEDRPFFLYVPLHAPHEHLATGEEFIQMYSEDNQNRDQAVYFGNVTQMDREFGRLLAQVDILGLRDSTFILFTSDNGPAHAVPFPYGSAGVLRGKKGSVYEGGIRVPGILRWPGKTRAGTVSNEAINGTDLLPTLCEIAGIEPPEKTLDGTSFLPIFSGGSIARKIPLFWQYNRQPEEMPNVALRHGDWKILAYLTPEPFDQAGRNDPGTYMAAFRHSFLHSFELYNLEEDIGEEGNLAQKEPERLEEMKSLLRELYDQIKREGPAWTEWRRPEDPDLQLYRWRSRRR